MRAQVTPSNVPGPATLRNGDSTLGYYGQVPTSEFITSTDLATQVNLTAGTALANNETWLKFAYKGKVLFVAMQPFRNFISPTQLEAANLINGAKTITFLGRLYKVRLMLGGAASPGNGSEWNDLIYRVHASDPTGSNWEAFTNADLVVGVGNGRTSWCQEIPSGTNRTYRGYASLTEWASGGTGSATATTGWRPVLELV